ncbi:MAG: enoyl-CoA hydratase/isomerase family protein [Actinobacteria bacterium]|nr:enoyl-CoA hydratase/isomerase family protein [Actinomycetota bacterium]
MASPAGAAEVSAALGTPVLVVDLDASDRSLTAGRSVSGLPAVLVGVHPQGISGAPPPLTELFDVVVADPEPVVATVEAAPQAAVTLALVLRATLRLDVPAALAAESAAYSMLQSGHEFARWKASSPGHPPAAEAGPAVLAERTGGCLHITLNRPARHNAVNATLQQALVEALLVAAADGSIERVVVEGAGPSFCSGGDLAEFGTLPDPATAHLVRLTRSPARLLAELAPRLEVRIHGACIGAGIEMAAFAGRVVAHADTLISLPEVSLGLIPGAGGTVSLPRRIGRHRTAELALTGKKLEAAEALRWGLVDAIEP